MFKREHCNFVKPTKFIIWCNCCTASIEIWSQHHQLFFQLQTKRTRITTEQWLHQYSATKRWCNIPYGTKDWSLFHIDWTLYKQYSEVGAELLLFYPHQSSLLLNGLLLSMLLLLLDYTNKSTRRWWSSSTQLPLFSAVRKDGQDDVFGNMINKPC